MGELYANHWQKVLNYSIHFDVCCMPYGRLSMSVASNTGELLHNKRIRWCLTLKPLKIVPTTLHKSTKNESLWILPIVSTPSPLRFWSEWSILMVACWNESKLINKNIEKRRLKKNISLFKIILPNIAWSQKSFPIEFWSINFSIIHNRCACWQASTIIAKYFSRPISQPFDNVLPVKFIFRILIALNVAAATNFRAVISWN